MGTVRTRKQTRPAVTMAGDADARVAALLELIGGVWSTQAVGVAAELGIADLLADGPKDAAALAAAASCDAESLFRLLRALVNLGIVGEGAAGFELTALGALLRSDSESSLRWWAIWTARHQWGPWGGLLHSVRTGESARKHTTGRGGYEHLTDDPEKASVFNQAMVENSRLVAASFVRAYDFSDARSVADLGGGHGELLVAILAANPQLRGLLLDLPHAIEGARSRIAGAGLSSRCELVAGSFFESLPAGYDVYLLKSILHNWDDARCVTLLGNCRRALGQRGRVLVVDRVVPERITGLPSERPALRSDLNMLVGLGGRERTRAEIESLLDHGGLVAGRFVPIALGYCVVEGASR